MKIAYYLFYILAITCFANFNSNAQKVEVISTKFVDNINANGVMYKWAGDTILCIKLNFYYSNDLAPEFETNSKEHNSQVYKRIIEATHFYVDNKEIKNVWGYWPEESGKNFAKSMTLFYRVPKARPENSLKFTCEGTILGNKDYNFTYTKFQ